VIARSTPSEVRMTSAHRSPTSSPPSAALRLRWAQPLAALPFDALPLTPCSARRRAFSRSVATRDPSEGAVTTPHAEPCTAGKLHKDSGVDGRRGGTYLLPSRGGVYPTGPGATRRGEADATGCGAMAGGGGGTMSLWVRITQRETWRCRRSGRTLRHDERESEVARKRERSRGDRTREGE